ncbi:hypothetical protein PG984_009086 [Apiospora sp. TS-2023a]
MSLRVEAYSSALFSRGDVEELATKIPIHVVMLFGNPRHHESNSPWHWEEILLRKQEQLFVPQGDLKAQPSIANAKRVRFTEKLTSATTFFSSKATTTQKCSNVEVTVAKTPQVDSQRIVSICNALRRKQYLPNTDCYGYIEGPLEGDPIKFAIRPYSTNQSSYWSTLTLRDVLIGHGTGLKYMHKLNLAALVARALLQLSGSSWLPEIMTSEDIVFLKKTRNPSTTRSMYQGLRRRRNCPNPN